MDNSNKDKEDILSPKPEMKSESKKEYDARIKSIFDLKNEDYNKFTSFDMDQEIQEGKIIKNNIVFEDKDNRDDPWFESIKDDYNIIRNKKKMNISNEEQEELNDINQKNNDDQGYYGEENLYFALDDVLSKSDVEKNKYLIYKIKQKLVDFYNLDFIGETDSISKISIKLKNFISKNKSKNGKKVRKFFKSPNETTFNTNIKHYKDEDNSAINDNLKIINKFNLLVQLISKATELGENNIYNENKTSLLRYINQNASSFNNEDLNNNLDLLLNEDKNNLQ